MRKIHTRGGKFPSFATPNAHFLQAVCLWQGCSFYFQFGATEFFVAPFVLHNFVANLPPRGAFFVVLFPFLLTWRCRLVLSPIARCFCFVGFGCVCATCRWCIVEQAISLFLVCRFSNSIVFVFPTTTLQNFNKTWFLRSVTSTMLWVFNKCVFHLRGVDGLCLPPLPLVYVAFVGDTCSHCLEKMPSNCRLFWWQFSLC